MADELSNLPAVASAPVSAVSPVSADSPARRRSRAPLVVLVVAAAVLGTGAWYFAAGYGAHLLRTEVIAVGAPVVEAAKAASGDLRAEITRARAESTLGSTLAGVAVESLGDAVAAAELADASARAGELARSADPGYTPDLVYDTSDLRPVWVSLVETFATIEHTDELRDETRELSAQTTRLEAARVDAGDRRAAFIESVDASADARLAASPVASYETRIAVRHAVDLLDGPMGLEDPAGVYAQISTALAAAEASQAAEAARRAEPEYAVRGPIEEFARSIAHGIALDFVWAETVNGLSSAEWYSGTAQYRYEDGGWATISLTHSVSDNWSADVNAKAVVVHEVGHSQVVRPECEPIFRGPVFAADDEMWATAWAIASGYDVPGSGIEAYGRPSDAQIAEAGRCL